MRIKTLFTGFCCGIILAPALAFAADTAPKAKQTVADTPFVIVAPSEEIVVTFPLFLVERGVVENVDVKNGTFSLKDKDGDVSTIKVTDNTLIEGRNIKHEKAFLIVLLVVPKIDKFPHAVIASEKSSLKLLSLIGRTRRFRGTIFKNNLRLRQILDDCRILSEKDQGCICHAVIRDRTAVVEKLLL